MIALILKNSKSDINKVKIEVDYRKSWVLRDMIELLGSKNDQSVELEIDYDPEKIKYVFNMKIIKMEEVLEDSELFDIIEYFDIKNLYLDISRIIDGKDIKMYREYYPYIKRLNCRTNKEIKKLSFLYSFFIS